MKIEFKKVPQNEKYFELKSDSVIFSGTFCRISSRLAKLDGHIKGELETTCAKCGVDLTLTLDEKQKYIISDGPLSTQDEREDELTVEIADHIVDFDELLKSELESIDSDLHMCDKCKDNDTFIDLEF
jgi:uncharacterized metal-binding protein YceD (DUF177 family)